MAAATNSNLDESKSTSISPRYNAAQEQDGR